jgi:hypothetical protein
LAKNLVDNKVMASVYDSLAKFKMLNEMDRIAMAVNLEDQAPVQAVLNITDAEGGQYHFMKAVYERRCNMLAALPFLKLDKASNSPLKYRVVRIAEIKKSSIKAYTSNSLRLCELGRDHEDYNFAYRYIPYIDTFLVGLCAKICCERKINIKKLV